MTMTKWGGLIAMALLAAGCGGGGGSGGPPPAESVPSVLFSDLLVSGPGYPNARVEDITCTADLSRCTAAFRGRPLSFSAAPAATGETGGASYTSLGAWTHMAPVVVKVAAEGLQGRLAALSGRTYANSLPVMGSATWEGTLVALDPANRPVRGGARLTIPDLARPAVDVDLTPEGHAVMTWDALRVTNGGFAARASESDSIRGAFYGPAAQEVGGVFERNQLLGAFGATR